jgi:hypothetical protein
MSHSQIVFAEKYFQLGVKASVERGFSLLARPPNRTPRGVETTPPSRDAMVYVKN